MARTKVIRLPIARIANTLRVNAQCGYKRAYLYVQADGAYCVHVEELMDFGWLTRAELDLDGLYTVADSYLYARTLINRAVDFLAENPHAGEETIAYALTKKERAASR